MSSEPVYMTSNASEWVTHYTRKVNGKVVYRDKWNTSYEALVEGGRSIPPSDVPVAEVNGDYYGPSIAASE